MTRYVLAIAVGLFFLPGCNFSQSPLTCIVGQGGGDPVESGGDPTITNNPVGAGWFAKYTLKPNQTITGPCTQNAGEGLGIRKYFPVAGQMPVVAIRSDTLGNMATQTTVPPDPDLTHNPNSSGALTADKPDANHLCIVSSLSKAEQNVGGSDISYEWSNVKFVVQANVPGTQMMATLRYTNGCTAEYKVVAMQPHVDCFKADIQGNPILDAMGNQTPDNSRCSPQNNVNPDFAVTCDPLLFKCVLATDPPALTPRAQ